MVVASLLIGFGHRRDKRRHRGIHGDDGSSRPVAAGEAGRGPTTRGTGHEVHKYRDLRNAPAAGEAARAQAESGERAATQRSGVAETRLRYHAERIPDPALNDPGGKGHPSRSLQDVFTHRHSVFLKPKRFVPQVCERVSKPGISYQASFGKHREKGDPSTKEGVLEFRKAEIRFSTLQRRTVRARRKRYFGILERK